MTREQIELAIYDLLDGVLPEQQVCELEQVLAESEEAREIYREAVKFHSALELRADGKQALGRSSAVVPMDRVVTRQRRKIVRIAAMAAAAVIVIGAVVMQFIQMPHETVLAGFEVAEGTRYNVVHSSEAQNVGRGELRVGSRLRLSQGTVELKFESGVRSVVQAPADLTLESDNMVALDEGVAWFHVPEEAVGFEVEAREVRVVDLGTEFGVISREGEPEEVHVLDGRVEVTHLWGGEPTRLELAAGMACIATDDEELASIAVDGPRFAKFLPDGLPYLHWSFDDADGLQVDGNHPMVAKIATAPRVASALGTTSEGRFGEALSLTVGSPVETNWYGISGRSPRTISYWVKLPPGKRPLRPIVGWGKQDGVGDLSNRVFYSLVQTKPQGTISGLSFGGYWFEGTTPIADDQWHHIVYTYSGSSDALGGPKVVCYIDGEIESFLAHPHEAATRGSYGNYPIQTAGKHSGGDSVWFFKPLQEVRRNSADRSANVEPELSIDELYIFEGELTEGEVRNLYRHNRTEEPIP